jgi:hypothetical protein
MVAPLLPLPALSLWRLRLRLRAPSLRADRQSPRPEIMRHRSHAHPGAGQTSRMAKGQERNRPHQSIYRDNAKISDRGATARPLQADRVPPSPCAKGLCAPCLPSLPAAPGSNLLVWKINVVMVPDLRLTVSRAVHTTGIGARTIPLGSLHRLAARPVGAFAAIRRRHTAPRRPDSPAPAATANADTVQTRQPGQGAKTGFAGIPGTRPHDGKSRDGHFARALSAILTLSERKARARARRWRSLDQAMVA